MEFVWWESLNAFSRSWTQLCYYYLVKNNTSTWHCIPQCATNRLVLGSNQIVNIQMRSGMIWNNSAEKGCQEQQWIVNLKGKIWYLILRGLIWLVDVVISLTSGHDKVEVEKLSQLNLLWDDLRLTWLLGKGNN